MRSDRRSSTSSEKQPERPSCAIAMRSSQRRAGRHTSPLVRAKPAAGLRYRRWALLTRDLVAAVAPDALRVRRYRRERDAELLRGELLARPVDHPDDNGFLHHVDPLRRGAAGGPARAAHAGGDVEGVAELGQLALHLLVGLELVDQAALEPPAHAGQLRLIQ